MKTLLLYIALAVLIYSCNEKLPGDHVTQLRLSFPPSSFRYAEYMKIMMDNKELGRITNAEIHHSETIFTVEFYNPVKIPRGSAFIMDPPDIFGNNYVRIHKSKQTAYYKNHELIAGEIGKRLSDSVHETIEKVKNDSSLKQLNKEINDVIQVVDSMLKAHKK